jgi:hypothetical protein
MVGEVVVLFECGSRLGKESVVSCTFALSFGFTFLLFRLFGRVIRWMWRSGHCCEGSC